MNKMAHGSDNYLVPELPANADQMLFVEDLFDFMQLTYPPNYVVEWDPRLFRKIILNCFNSSVQNALSFIEQTLETCHYEIFCEIQNENSVNSNTYKRFAENLAAYLPKGFHSKYILIYCSILCRMSVYFYNHGVFDATVLAKKYILKFLRKYNMQVDEWDSLHMAAEFYEKKLLHTDNVPSPDSDEIEHIVQPQNEMSGDEANTFRNKEQNDSSENKEGNHKEQRKFVCSQKKPFLKESARRVLKSNCGADANFSKRSGSSYKNIKDDCRKRMLLAWNSVKYGNHESHSDENKSIDKSASDKRFCPGPSNAYQEFVEVSNIDCKKNLSISRNAIDSKNPETLSTKGDKSINKSASIDRSCTRISNAYKISRSSSLKDCRRKLFFSSDITNGANYSSKSCDKINLVHESGANNLASTALNSDPSGSSRIKLDFSSNNENVKNVRPLRDRSPILRDTINNTRLESPPSSDNEESPPSRDKLK